MDNPEDKSLSLLSYCTGYGGIELGLELAGLRIGRCVYVERECYAAAVVVKAIEAGALAPGIVHTDLKTFPAENFRGCFTGLVGGYPCQPFSTAGNREGAKDSKGRHLWPYFKRTIELVRPGFCFFENVEGHLTLGFKDVCHDLGELGYEYSAGIFSAEECGAPHQRRRVFILAYSNSSRGNQDWISAQLRAAQPFQSSCNCWPSTPGEIQKKWEVPRLVADPNILNGGTRRESRESTGESSGKPIGNDCTLAEPPERETFPGLGGSIDGPDDFSHPAASYMGPAENRIDRLRMLGNGVIAQTAAKAFMTLWMELEQ